MCYTRRKIEGGVEALREYDDTKVLKPNGQSRNLNIYVQTKPQPHCSKWWTIKIFWAISNKPLSFWILKNCPGRSWDTRKAIYHVKNALICSYFDKPSLWHASQSQASLSSWVTPRFDWYLMISPFFPISSPFGTRTWLYKSGIFLLKLFIFKKIQNVSYR